jgi:hypothetical protein
MILLLAAVAEADYMKTYDDKSCAGTPNFTFNTNDACQDFYPPAEAISVTEVGSWVRTTVHNTDVCDITTQVGSFYGEGCLVAGWSQIKAVHVGPLGQP